MFVCPVLFSDSLWGMGEIFCLKSGRSADLNYFDNEEERDGERGEDDEETAERHELGEYARTLVAHCIISIVTNIRC